MARIHVSDDRLHIIIAGGGDESEVVHVAGCSNCRQRYRVLNHGEDIKNNRGWEESEEREDDREPLRAGNQRLLEGDMEYIERKEK